MKKSLKIGLITGASVLIVGGAWAGLTKAGVIPNWLGIEALCSCKDCHGVGFYEGEFPQIDGKECCEGSYRIIEKTDDENDYNDGSNIIYNEGATQLTSEDNNIFNQQSSETLRKNPDPSVSYTAAKPIIYLYPISETEVHVELGTPENLSHTYPKYNSEKGWNVIAQPNGNLEDIDTGRKLYALYREGKSDNKTNFNEGFVVAGKDIIPFLEEKLATLGLNEREAEEFIVYWLPQMENNEWNLIRFETKAEQDKSMPLNITPTPDTVIRVMMDWKAIDEPIDIPEQQLTTPERNGFTVVEWGGSPRN